MIFCTAGSFGQTLAKKTTLRDAARGRFLVGTAVSHRQIDDKKDATLISTQFDCMTAENEFKPSLLQPSPGKFDFTIADKMIEFADKNNLKVVGHTLLWHNQSPTWLFMDENRKPLSRELALSNLKNYIDNVAGHFKGKVIGWDVVNEALSDAPDEYLRNTPAKRAIGDDYIQKAFEFAHAADPGAQLYYNDYNNDAINKRAKNIRLIRELKSKGVFITAVGIQAHYLLKDTSSPSVLDDAIKAYAAEGVKVMLTELDVDVLPRSKGAGADLNATEKDQHGNLYPKSLPPQVAAAQASYYRDLFKVVLKYPSVVTRVTLWGSGDGDSWLNNFPIRGRTNHALLFDRQLKPKPAFYSVLDVLNEK